MIEEFGQYNRQSGSLYSGGPLGDDQPARTVAQGIGHSRGRHPGVFGGPLAAPWLLFRPCPPASWIMAGPPLLKLTLTESNSGLNTGIRYALNVAYRGYFTEPFYGWSGQGFRRFFQSPRPGAPARFPSRRFRSFWRPFLPGSIGWCWFPYQPSRAFSFIVPDSFQPRVYVPPTLQVATSWERSDQLLAQIPA